MMTPNNKTDFQNKLFEIIDSYQVLINTQIKKKYILNPNFVLYKELGIINATLSKNRKQGLNTINTQKKLKHYIKYFKENYYSRINKIRMPEDFKDNFSSYIKSIKWYNTHFTLESCPMDYEIVYNELLLHRNIVEFYLIGIKLFDHEQKICDLDDFKKQLVDYDEAFKIILSRINQVNIKHNIILDDTPDFMFWWYELI